MYNEYQCVAGSAAGCMLLGLHEKIEGRLLRAKILLESSCRSSSTQACLELAFMAAENGFPEASEGFFRRACRLGLAQGCDMAERAFAPAYSDGLEQAPMTSMEASSAQ